MAGSGLDGSAGNDAGLIVGQLGGGSGDGSGHFRSDFADGSDDNRSRSAVFEDDGLDSGNSDGFAFLVSGSEHEFRSFGRHLRHGHGEYSFFG